MTEMTMTERKAHYIIPLPYGRFTVKVKRLLADMEKEFPMLYVKVHASSPFVVKVGNAKRISRHWLEVGSIPLPEREGSDWPLQNSA